LYPKRRKRPGSPVTHIIFSNGAALTQRAARGSLRAG
jgi:hypothetical protein